MLFCSYELFVLASEFPPLAHFVNDFFHETKEKVSQA